MKSFAIIVLLAAGMYLYGQGSPPQVSIIQPLNGSVFTGGQINVVYSVSGSEPKSALISVNDKSVQLLSDVKLGENTVMVEAPDGNCKISVTVRNEFGSSVPATVNLLRDGHIFKPSLYVLAIGVSNYENPELRLQFPAKDASDFSQAVMRQAGLLYESVDVKLLADRKATAENIRDGLQWLQTETTSRDIAMLYIAGHGINNNAGIFYFMPVNADLDRINATCVSYSDIKNTISAVSGKLLVFMDACHSGNVLGSTQQRAASISQAVGELTGADNGPVIFTSSTGRQFSLESPEWNNGAFTRALLEGLNGAADLLGKNTVTVKSLEYYIASRVKELTHGQQSPTTIIPRSVPDFPIAVVTVKVDVNVRIENPQPAAAVKSERLLTGNETFALLHIYRPWGHVGAEVGIEVYMGNERISVLSNHSKTTVQINNPGKHTVSATYQDAPGNGKERQRKKSEIHINTVPGHEYYIRIMPGSSSKAVATVVNSMTGGLAVSSHSGAVPVIEIPYNEDSGKAEYDAIF
jgi:hypothetical protein